VKFPPLKDCEADLLSISPLSEQIIFLERLWVGGGLCMGQRSYAIGGKILA